MPDNSNQNANYLAYLWQRIKDVRQANLGEMNALGWLGLPPPLVLVLDDDTVLIPASDTEGDAPGALFAIKSGKAYTLFP